MGQAKQRGTFEVRKVQSIERRNKRMAELEVEIKALEAAKTPEQRKKESRAKNTLSIIAAIAGMGASRR